MAIGSLALDKSYDISTRESQRLVVLHSSLSYTMIHCSQQPRLFIDHQHQKPTNLAHVLLLRVAVTGVVNIDDSNRIDEFRE